MGHVCPSSVNYLTRINHATPGLLLDSVLLITEIDQAFQASENITDQHREKYGRDKGNDNHWISQSKRGNETETLSRKLPWQMFWNHFI